MPYEIWILYPGEGWQYYEAKGRGKAYQKIMNCAGTTLQQATDMLDSADKIGRGHCHSPAGKEIYVNKS